MESKEYADKCYLLGRYLEYYKENETYNETANNLITEGLKLRAENKKITTTSSNDEIIELDPIDFLLHMTAKDNTYDSEDKKRCPILLYKSEPICYGVLNEFIDNIARELDANGYLVEIYDLVKEGSKNLQKIIGKRFKAIIGIQTKVFSIKLSDGENLHDLIFGPKFMICLDHPGTMYDIFTDAPKDFFIITHDIYYKEYIENYYSNVKKIFIIPPGGNAANNSHYSHSNKDIPFSFVGSYHDYRQLIPLLTDFDKKNDNLGTEFIIEAEKNRKNTLETTLHNILMSHVKAGKIKNPTSAEFARIFSTLRVPINIVINKTKEKILLALLNSGLELHVYGNSWTNAQVFKKFNNLIIHPEVTPVESYDVYARSKVSLNIMSFHKAGMTERLANMMLNHTVIVTDESEYLNENYINNEDMIIFSLDEESINHLPKRIQDIITNDNIRVQMANSTYKKAAEKETWNKRTSELINAINIANYQS